MTQVDPKHNLTALLIGTAEFSFSEGATSAANAIARGYQAFGNVVAYSPAVELKKEDHFGSYRGIRKKDKSFVTESKVEYKLKLDEFTPFVCSVYMGAQDNGAYQDVPDDTTYSSIEFDGSGLEIPVSIFGRWLPVQFMDGGNVPHYIHNIGPGALLVDEASDVVGVEGTHYLLDRALGRILWLAQPDNPNDSNYCFLILDPADPETAVTGAFNELVPLSKGVRKGYGRLTVFDQASPTVVLEHLDFSCELLPDSLSEVDGQKVAQIGITVAVTDDVGVVHVRNGNKN